MKIKYISLKEKIKEIMNKNEGNAEVKEKKDKIDLKKFKDLFREKIKENQTIQNFKAAPKGSYVLLLVMIALLMATAKVNIETYKKIEKENYDTYVMVDDVATEPVSNSNVVIYKEDSSSIFEVNETAVEASSNHVEDSNENDAEEEKYVYSYQYIRPVKGETLKEYSMDKVIYSKTLDLWKVHDGIDICAEIGTEVKACEKGIIERIYEDGFYGYSVIIDHQNGIKTIYRNLDEKMEVKEGDRIEKGEVIGLIGNSAEGEGKDEPHIHFEVLKNGEVVNPNIIGIK